MHAIRDIPYPVDDSIQEHDLHRVEIVFDGEQAGSQLYLLFVVLLLDLVQPFDHRRHQLHLGAPETGLEEFVEFVDRGAGLPGGLDGTVGILDHVIRDRGRNLHFATQHQPGDVLGLVRDHVLQTQHLEQIDTRDGHENAFRQVQPDIPLDLVRLVLQSADRSLDFTRTLPVTLDCGLEECLELGNTQHHLLHVLLNSLDRCPAKNFHHVAACRHDLTCSLSLVV
jgi:hypothetical protein